jgi:integrase
MKQGDGRYRVTINLGSGPDGKRRKVTVTRKTKRAAVQAAQEKLDDINAGVRVDGGKTTVAGWLDYWYTNIIPLRRLRPNTLSVYKARITHSILPTLGTIQLGRLTPAHVRDMHADLARRGLSISTARLAHVVLNKALDDAVAEGLIARNPAATVDQPRGDTEERPALDVLQARHLIATAIDAQDPMAARWAAALLLGARQGELLGLTWDRVDFDAGTIDLAWALVAVGHTHGCATPCGRPPRSCPSKQLKVPRGYSHIPLSGGLVLGHTKTTGSTRTVPMIGPIRQALEDHRMLFPEGEHGLVWTTRKRTAIHPRNDLKAWQKALQRAGLPPMPLHSARHTAATILQSMKVDEAVRMKILGHNSQTEHRGYAHVDHELTRAALDGYGQALGLGAGA